jgi:hypothetical protein
MSTDSPCRAGPSALVGKNTSGTVQLADSAQYPGSSATSCAARLRDCRAHSTSVRRRSTGGGEPLASRLPLGISTYTLSMYLEINISVYVYIYIYTVWKMHACVRACDRQPSRLPTSRRPSSAVPPVHPAAYARRSNLCARTRLRIDSKLCVFARCAMVLMRACVRPCVCVRACKCVRASVCARGCVWALP